MKNNKTLIKILLGLLAISFVSLAGWTGNAMAAIRAGGDQIAAKATFEGVRNCLNGGSYKEQFWTSNLLSDGDGFMVYKGNDDAVKLPYDLTSVNDNNLNCQEVLFGYQNIVLGSNHEGIKGGLIPFDVRNSNNNEEKAKYFAGSDLSGNGGLGYQASPKAINITGSEMSLYYDINNDESTCGDNTPLLLDANNNPIGTITFPTIAKNGNTLLVSSNSYNVPTPGSGESYTFKSSCFGAKIQIKDVGASGSPKYEIWVTYFEEGGITSGEPIQRSFTISAETTKNGAEYDKANNTIKATSPNGLGTIVLQPRSVTYDAPSKDEYSSSNDYLLTRGTYMKFMNGLNSNNRVGYNVSQVYAGYNPLALSRQEVYDLYRYYVTDVLNVGNLILCVGDADYNLYPDASPINWKGGDSGCKIHSASSVNIPENLYGVDSGYHFTTKITSIQDIIGTLDSLGDLCSPKLDGVEGCNSSSGSSGGTTTGSENEFDCDRLVDEHTDGEGIGAMQWLLCPGLNNSTYTATWIDNWTQNRLTINVDLYSNDGTFKVWGTIRDITNVVMVLFLMVIIISQITGYGIDNYGVKKMLPRLIMMAIIVNLSYYICEIAIDFSNILGVGLRDMFANIGGGDSGGNNFLIDMMMGIFSAAGTGGSVAAGAVVTLGLGGWVAVVVVLLILALVIIIALFVLMLMLGARDILVVFCLVISPLAFVMFVLPNTQHLFKKWWTLFQAAIIIFPICGMVAGISAMLRGMFNNNVDLGVWGRVVALVLPYLVFFLLPMLLKNAFSALGKIGGALTSLGQSVRGGGRAIGQGAMRRAQSTERYKNMQEEAARRRRERYADRVMSRHGDGSNIRDRIEDAQRRLAANPNDRRAQRDLLAAQRDQRRFYTAQQSHYQLEAEQAVASTTPEVLAARAQSSQESLEFKNISDQFANASTSQIQNALVEAENAYAADRNSANTTRLRAMQSIAMGKGMNSNVLEGLGRLALNDSNENDQRVLNSINYSNLYSGLTRSQLGNELQSAVNAYNTDRSESNTRRLQNIIKAADGRGMDKEMLASLGNLELGVRNIDGSDNRNDAVIIDTLSGAKNEVASLFGVQMGKPANVGERASIDNFVRSTGNVKFSTSAAGKDANHFNNASDDTLEYVASRSASGTPIMPADTLANIVSNNTTAPKVLTQARNIYRNMNADDINFSGKQLAKFDADTLQILATKIRPNSQLQKNFITAINDIAKNPELMSGLKPEQRELFKAIRRGAGINDNLFDA